MIVDTNKEIIKNNFSKYAKFYDRYSIIQNLCASDLINKIKSNGFKDILDIGCGTGNYTKLIRAKFPFAKIKAIDISQEMVFLAKKKLVKDNIEFKTADAEIVKLKKKFDLITSNATFQWFKDLEQALTNYKKLLKKNGQIIFSIFGPLTFYELQESLEQFKPNEISIAASSFPGRKRIEDILKSLFSDFKIEQKIYKEKFSFLTDLLKKIKYTGTRGKGLEKKSFWTAKAINEIEKIYKKNFKDIVVTYQVFYVQLLLRM